MTREGQGTGPDQPPLEPTRTRWSEAEGGEDPGVLAPFVPGRGRPQPTAEPAAEPEATVEAEAERPVEPKAPAPPGPAEAEEEPFPWAVDEEAGAPAVKDDQDVSWDETPADEPWGEPVDVELEALEPSGDAAGQLAARLDALAARLRSEGVRGMEAAMGSEDRITALLAGFLAGYLAGRES